MSAVVVYKSFQHVACHGKATRILNGLKFSYQVLATCHLLKWVGHGRSITLSDLVAYSIELVVMSWDVMCSRRLVKHGELPTSYLPVATTLKATSQEFTTTSHELTTTFLRVSVSSHHLSRRDVM